MSDRDVVDVVVSYRRTWFRTLSEGLLTSHWAHARDLVHAA